MDCREARTNLGRGIANDAAVNAHLAICEECRAAAQAVRSADAILLPLLEVTGEPSPPGAQSTAAAVRAEFARTPVLRPFLPIAAAALLLLVGGLGGWLLRSDSPIADPDGLSSALAAHELEVFREVRAALGGDLAWLATVDGEVVVGLSPGEDDGELRVVLMEVRDDEGGVLARLNVVVPDEREVEVGVPGAPRMRMSVGEGKGGAAQLVCSLAFEDGAELGTPGLGITEGETALLGKVRTNGAMRSVFVALY